jgi:hypothetical protein
MKEVLEILIDLLVKKVNFVLSTQIHQKKSFEIPNNVVLIPFLDMTYI